MNQGRGWLSKYWSGTTQRSQNWVTKHRPAIVRVSFLSVLGFTATFFVADWIETGYLKNFLTPDQTITISEKQDKQGNILETTETTTEKPKTLWDLADLVIVPLVLFGLGAWFQRREKKREEIRSSEEKIKESARQAQLQEIADKNREQDLQIADNKQKDAILQNYFDSMKGLLLEKGLKSSEAGAEVRDIARILTLTVFRQLDSSRNKLVTQFLQESGLIHINSDQEQATDDPILNLNGADLSSVNLNGANLRETFLCHANLNGADLSHATLSSANLEQSNLSLADLSNTNFNEANLNEANLRGTNLSRADLNSASLIEANFDGVNLSHANLKGANLSYADLSYADLSGANLKRANLQDAQLQKAILIRTDLSTARYLTAERLEGENAPYLYKVELPPTIDAISVDKLARDYEELPQILMERYPERFKTIEEAKRYMEE